MPRATLARVVSLIGRDVANTLGPGYEAVVEEAAARNRLFCENALEFEQDVVNDIQQYLHDSRTDPTWPSCPEHPHHPLWYSDQRWRCQQTGTAVARLGELSAGPRLPGDLGP